ncbi:MAG TPA: serine hydrolase [Thermomicrobiales bacterium]|nr:serine hydrolase [Thermomicrobiales bacterium]
MDITSKDAGRHERTGGRFSRRAAIGYGGAVVATIGSAHLPRMVSAQTPAATPSTSVPSSWDEIDSQLESVAPSTALLAAELVDGDIVPVHAFNADQVLPIGSSFKLWILGTLAQQVEAGELDWEQIVEIEDRYRSVPGGDLRYVAAGTPFTMRYLAERMIQKSDNTATDHMLFLAGRENVEQMMTAMGVSDPSRNIPLLSTRELTMLKFASPTDRVDAYVAASVEERRRILTEEIDTIPYEALADLDQTAPIEIDRIEWFATREDLARTMAWLLAESRTSGLWPVTEILSLETPVPFEGETWPYVGYKGGSELGVLSATWLLQRNDGRFFVYTVGFRNPDAGIDMPSAIAVIEAGRDRLALTP